MCFSLFLFDVLLFSFFILFSPLLVISSCFQLFCLPSFWQKKLFLFYLFFFDLLSFFLFFCQLFFFFNFSLFTHFWIFCFHSKYLSLLLCTCFSLFPFFFLKKKKNFFISLFAHSFVLFFRCLHCFSVHFSVFLSVFSFQKKHFFDLLSFFWREK